jgi:lipid IVA palmitoyltransferase
MEFNLKRLLIAAAIVLALPGRAFAVECTDFWTWLEPGCRRLVDTYENGENQLFISGYSYHLPSTYTPEKRAQLNSNAWGGGVGRTVEEPNGNTHTVFFYAFEDSHKTAQIQAGYAWATYWGDRDGVQPGLGWTAFIVQRPDIASGVPVPAALPIALLRYKKANLIATYIPTLNGGVNHGSTLYVFGQIGLQ